MVASYVTVLASAKTNVCTCGDGTFLKNGKKASIGATGGCEPKPGGPCPSPSPSFNQFKQDGIACDRYLKCLASECYQAPGFFPPLHFGAYEEEQPEQKNICVCTIGGKSGGTVGLHPYKPGIFFSQLPPPNPSAPGVKYCECSDGYSHEIGNGWARSHRRNN